ncbi:MAG: methyltransferase domain-containing protein [Shewanella sp.]
MPSQIKASEPKENEPASCELKVSASAVMKAVEVQVAEKRAIDKEFNVHGALIAERFSAAAHSYHHHNPLQRLSAASLRREFTAKGYLLDIGAGPGTDFSAHHSGHHSGHHSDHHSDHTSTPHRPATVIAVDIALGMLHKLKQSYPDYHGVCADAQCLPFVDGCIDVIYSNLALQWCAHFPAAVAEMARVLKPDAECHLSLVAQGSLQQLAQLGLRVNDFSTLASLKAAFDLYKWQFLDVQIIPMTVYFDTLKALLYSIKGVGASVQSVCSTDPTTEAARDVVSSIAAAEFVPLLRGRQDWLAMQAKAEYLRLPQGLPLTYQIVQIRARRRM